MLHPIRRFEILVLRPLWVVTFVGVVWFAIDSRWCCLAAFVLCLFYLGIIGAKLHPLQSAVDLTAGPTTGPAALKELEVLPAHIQLAIVGAACTRVGLFCGAALAIIVLAVFQYPWYVALIAALLVTILAGSILKFVFQTQAI